MRFSMASSEILDRGSAPYRSATLRTGKRIVSLFFVPSFVLLTFGILTAAGIGLADSSLKPRSAALAQTSITGQPEIEAHGIPSVFVSGTVARSSHAANPALLELMTEVGRRWTYMFVSERTRTFAGGAPEIERMRGTRIDEITGTAPEFGEGVVRMHSSWRGRSASNQNESTEEHAGFYRATGSSFQLVAEQASDPNSGLAAMVRYEVPLAVLETAAEPGQRWSVGVRSQQDLHTELEGELLGVQDVQTPQGPFERCLVIRLKGQTSGVVEVYGSRMEVPTGDYSITQWYAPGVGLVLAKEEINQTLVFEDGRSMDYSERTQFALRSTESPAAAAPAAGQH